MAVSINLIFSVYGFLILIGVPQLELAKFGPWGGDGGKPRDIKMLPYLLDNITISSGTIINSIGFSYTDHYGQHHTIGPWGGKEGKNKVSMKRIMLSVQI